MSRRLFTSESVTEGHPDKIADQISDTILDALLREDPTSRVAVETLITTGLVHVAGEVTTKAYAPIAQLVREKILDIGYDSSKKGFDGASCGVSVSIGAQSPDIAQGVDTAYEKRVEGDEDELDKQGAGDQGLMFGYACDETPELMPLPIHLAHRLSRRLSEVRKNGTIPYLRPDGKTQVTIEYDGDKAVRLDTVVVSSQHASDIDLDSLLAPDIREFVVEHVLKQLVEDGIKLDTEGYRLLVNPTGRFPPHPVHRSRPGGRRHRRAYPRRGRPGGPGRTGVEGRMTTSEQAEQATAPTRITVGGTDGTEAYDVLAGRDDVNPVVVTAPVPVGRPAAEVSRCQQTSTSG
ncbi:S-adenosylmethionine synthase [Streptomyces spiroverticillatus]